MKTMNFRNGKSSFGKVILRSGAVVASVVLLSFTVSAEGLWKQLLAYNSFGKTAILMVNATETAKTKTVEPTGEVPAPAEEINFRIEPAVDETLEIKPWTTSDVNFLAFSHFIDAEKEQPLELESWMTDDNYFKSRFATDKDEELKIEAWMIDDNYWKQ